MKKFLLKVAAWAVFMIAVIVQLVVDLILLPVLVFGCLFIRELGWDDFKEVICKWMKAIPEAIVEVKKITKEN